MLKNCGSLVSLVRSYCRWTLLLYCIPQEINIPTVTLSLPGNLLVEKIHSIVVHCCCITEIFPAFTLYPHRHAVFNSKPCPSGPLRLLTLERVRVVIPMDCAVHSSSSSACKTADSRQSHGKAEVGLWSWINLEKISRNKFNGENNLSRGGRQIPAVGTRYR